MSIGPLKRRSSYPSSFVTGLIGWNGFYVVLAVLLGQGALAGKFFVHATIAAVAQVVVLRTFFSLLRLDKSMIAGAFWGGVTGAVAFFVQKQFTDIFDAYPIIWFLNAFYIGIAVGLFLVYFSRDDRRIEKEAGDAGSVVDYGRDANWLEPFVFGAIAYLVAFVPPSFPIAAIVAVLGAVSGVVAAGVSHFFLFASPRKSLFPVILGIVFGLVQGALTGIVMWSFKEELITSPFVHGAAAGALTYLMTVIRGRSLANREMPSAETA